MTQERTPYIPLVVAAEASVPAFVPIEASKVSKERSWANQAASKVIDSNLLLSEIHMLEKDDIRILEGSMAEKLLRGKVNELSRRTGIRRRFTEASRQRYLTAYEEVSAENQAMREAYVAERDRKRVKAISDAGADFIMSVELATERSIDLNQRFITIARTWAYEWAIKIYPYEPSE